MEELEQIRQVLGTLKVDGWENYEKLVYVKLILDKLIKGKKEE